MIEAALRAMRRELLDGVSSIGARLGELRLDTDIDVSHGVVRYLELVKLAALLERPKGQSIAEALADVNARLLAAVTPLQREIFESSTLDEELLAGRASGHQAGSARTRAPAGEPSLQRFLPRREGALLLSASDIDLYRACPLRYKFARVLRVPTELTRNQRFGIAMHQVLERYHASGGQTCEQLLALFMQCWRRGGFGDGPEDRRLREKATAALRRYHARLSEQASEPVWFERSFAFQIGTHHVRGRVDRIDRLPGGGYEVIDYKTGRPKSEEQLREDVQLSLYALAASESWQLTGCTLAYYHLLDDVKVPLPAGSADTEWVRTVALEVGEATPSRAACSMCDYRVLCPVAEA
jgi:DNA helicase-2/ATP-dependent DNA helicase PcrA